VPDDRALQDTHLADGAPADCLGRVHRAVDFILANLGRSPTLDDIAPAVHCRACPFPRVGAAQPGGNSRSSATSRRSSPERRS